MLKNRQLIYKNVKNKRVRHGLIYGSNPNRATRWCHQPTGPTFGFYKSKWKLKLNLGFWGVANAIGNVRNNSQMGDANP